MKSHDYYWNILPKSKILNSSDFEKRINWFIQIGWFAISEKTKWFISCTKKESGEVIKILSPKQMLQRLSVALTQVKAGNNSRNLLNQIGSNFLSTVLVTDNPKKVNPKFNWKSN